MTVDGGLTPVGADTIAGRVREHLRAGGPVYVLSPPLAVLMDLTLSLFADPPVGGGLERPVRVLASPSTLADCFDAFRVGNQAAELAARGVVGYRSAEHVDVSGPVVVGPDDATAVVTFEGTYTLFEADARSVRRVTRDRAADAFERATRPTIPDRPDWRTVAQDLRDRTDPETLSSLTALLDARRVAGADRTLDVPTVTLLAGARTAASQKALAEWCVDHSIAAKSTVSTRKQRLVERGLVATVPVAGSVGAPVHRLEPADDYLGDLPPAECYEVVADVLRPD